MDLGGGVKLEMVLIPAGEFLMGSPDSDKDAATDEKPQHRVRITKPFYLGKYLVTQEQWEAVMGNNPSHFKGPKNPVETRQLGRLPEVSRQAEREGRRAGRHVPVAHRGPVGICLPGGEHDAVLLRGRRAASSANMRGTTRTRAARRTRWARRSRTPGGCTTCTGTYGSGARTGMMADTTRIRRRTIRRGLQRARAA